MQLIDKHRGFLLSQTKSLTVEIVIAFEKTTAQSSKIYNSYR